MKLSRRKFVRSGALWLLAAPQIIVPARAQMGRSPAFKAAAALQGQPAGGPTTLFSDDFNRSNSTNLGTNWTEVEDNSSISSNQLLLGVGGFSSVITTTNAHADTANITATAKHVSATVDGGILARCTNATAAAITSYVLLIVSSTNELMLWRLNAGEGTNVSTVSQAPSAGVAMALLVSGTGATVTLQAWYNGVLKIDTTDTSCSRLTTAGRTGLVNFLTADANSRFDDFSVTTP